MKKNIRKTKIITYTAMELLVILLLVAVGIKNNVDINSARTQSELRELTCISVTETERPDAPLGSATEYVLNLGELTHDTNLAFYTSHSLVEVYIEGELVYSMKTSGEISKISTPGSNWCLVPIYHNEAGNEVKVVVIPVYEGFLNEEIDFYLGYSNAVFENQIRENLPEITVTLLVLLLGITFTGLGMVLCYKAKNTMNFIALGTFALTVSLWRLCDFPFVAFFAGNKSTFVYYISLTMLIISMIPLLESVKNKFPQNWNKAFNILSIIISITCIFQLILQAFGIADLRQMLTLTHLTIVATILFILICLVVQLFSKNQGDKKEFNTVSLLVAGVALDLILFYVKDTSMGLIFTLLAVLIYVAMEGFRFVIRYIEQIDRLTESEIKLAHNETKLAEIRFTTMMSQIRSHFIFNILNAISGMCKYDPEKADKTIVHFARFLRSNIDIMQDDELVHFHNALRHLEDYVALEQVRYGDSIHFETDLQEEDFMLPPLVMQPLVENSIKHGLMPKANGGTITLRTRKDNDNIYIIIEDDGIGYDSSVQPGEHSIGLQNTRFRLAHMVKGDLKMESIVDIGTKATITIPRKEAEQCG